MILLDVKEMKELRIHTKVLGELSDCANYIILNRDIEKYSLDGQKESDTAKMLGRELAKEAWDINNDTNLQSMCAEDDVVKGWRVVIFDKGET